MSIRNKIIANLEERLFRSSLISKIDGVNIVNLRHEDDGFKEIVTLSLELLKKYDTKRYRRVINETLWIVNTYQVHEYYPEYSSYMVHEFNSEEWQFSHNKSKIRVFLKKLARVMRN